MTHPTIEAAALAITETTDADFSWINESKAVARVILSAPVSEQMELAAYEAWRSKEGSSANERMAASIRAAMAQYRKELGAE